METRVRPAASRAVRVSLWLASAILLLLTGCSSSGPEERAATQPALELSDQQMAWIGRQVYRNECASRRSCLVHWNEGEAFPSLGIGHFIWYPMGTEGRFVESFPDMIRFLDSQDAELPGWLRQAIEQGAPWPDRAAFLQAEGHDSRIEQLRQLLEQEQAGQAAFLLKRAQGALQRVAKASDDYETTRNRIRQLTETPGGAYALIDYVNFKGEGLAESERYDGVGWGLLQVLETMDPESTTALSAFRQAAAEVLTVRARRADNPIERERWLPGWLKRVETYREPDPYSPD